MMQNLHIIARFMLRTVRHAMAHSHEVAIGLIVEAEHTSLVWMILIMGALMVVFAIQAILNPE